MSIFQFKSGAHVNAATKAGFTPLVFAVMKNDANSVEQLLKAGADSNQELGDKSKVLSLATANRSDAATLALLAGGANPNVADKTGATPLHM